MYKSAYKNFINNHIKKFNVSDLLKDRKRKNMIIEPVNVSKKSNTIFKSIFKNIDSNISLNIIEKNSILQYNKINNVFIIITPYNREYEVKLEQYSKCGIDIGCRTFLTVYSPEKTLEIGTKDFTYNIIDKYHKKLDSLHKNRDNKKINDKTFKKSQIKYQEKLNNFIGELHNKSSRYILERFEVINIGKISIKLMVSNLTGNLQKKTKRRLLALSHYKFRMKLLQMSTKWNNKINLINEYMTTKKCSCCNNIKYDIGSNKIYNCSVCGLLLDRDINASINIYNL